MKILFSGDTKLIIIAVKFCSFNLKDNPLLHIIDIIKHSIYLTPFEKSELEMSFDLNAFSSQFIF